MTNPCTIRGIPYPSQSAAAAVIGVPLSTISAALEAGDPDRARPRPPCNRRAIKIDGRHFESMLEGAAAIGASKSAMYRAILRARDRGECITRYRSHIIEWTPDDPASAKEALVRQIVGALAPKTEAEVRAVARDMIGDSA